MPEVPTKVATLLEKQIHNELHSHLLYLAMSAFFERGAFKGFASWMKKQAMEEHTHAMKIYDYLIERNNTVIIGAVSAPKTEYKSPAEVFRAALAAEQAVTKSFQTLYAAALAEKDFATVEFLNWFVKEQVEEEDAATEILDRVELAGADTASLLQLDHEAGERK